MFSRKKQNFIPNRQMGWKKYAYLRNSEMNIFYDCQCGKRYISFPAIFLHIKRKHNRKVSINSSSNDFELRKTQDETVYFYFIKKRKQTIQIGTNQASALFDDKFSDYFHPFLINFMHQEKAELEAVIKMAFLKKMLMKFQTFLEHLLGNNEKLGFQHHLPLQTLPLYFNSFIESLILNNQLQTQQNFSSLCFAILKLSKWLNKKQISDLVVELNTE